MRATNPARTLRGAVSPNRICLGCLRPTRSFSSSTTHPPIPPRSGVAPLASRQLLSVAGPDAAKFLQGLITANVLGKDGLPRTDGFYAGFLTATGRVLHDLYIYPNTSQLAGVQDDNAFLVEVDANHVDSLARFVKRYKLRAKVNVRKVLPDEVQVWQAWDGAGLELASTAASPQSIRLRDDRVPGFGYRILQSGQGKPEVDLEQTTEDAYTVRRYLHGLPEGQDEILRETALPQESNMDYMGGIDFRKGCYIGQELTIRTKHRGVVRKRILPCVIYGGDEPAPTTLEYRPVTTDDSSSSSSTPTADLVPQDTSIGRLGKRGRSAGKWLRGVGNIGLGLCRLEIMTDVTLPGEAAAASFQPDDEFQLEWGEEGDRKGVKVKAFVPDWLRRGLDEASHG